LGHYVKTEVPPDASMTANTKTQSEFVNSYLTTRRIRTVFLFAFSKLRKATINPAMSVCPSVHTEQLGPHRKDFHEILYEYFSKICRENTGFV
jgi:hypothetical protein